MTNFVTAPREMIDCTIKKKHLKQIYLCFVRTCSYRNSFSKFVPNNLHFSSYWVVTKHNKPQHKLTKKDHQVD